MARPLINVDKTEIVLTVIEGKNVSTMNLAYNDVKTISFEPITEFRFFRKVPSEKIAIVTNKRMEPIEYKKLKNKPYFEEYKKQLEQFAQRHRITFKDLTK